MSEHAPAVGLPPGQRHQEVKKRLKKGLHRKYISQLVEDSLYGRKFPTETIINNRLNMHGCLLRVEGRTWYTSHRGRLWIAAAAKKPTPQEVAEVEAMYRHIYNKGKVMVRCRSFSYFVDKLIYIVHFKTQNSKVAQQWSVFLNIYFISVLI